MGITLNVWVFSGIIGAAYIMGYLMSRTMGRMLAVEGAESAVDGAERRETAWPDGAKRREKAWSGRAGLREAAARTDMEERRGAAQSDEADRRDTPQSDRAALRDMQAWLRRDRAYAARRQSRDRDGGLGETREWQKTRTPHRYRSRAYREQQARPAGHPIASPVAGQVDILESQGRRGVRFTPEENRVYAPASGKIIRLYPRGNEFLLRTDSGVVLRLQAGERDAEMTRDYFRPRVMQNEFVGKGKLLLEYDREALARDGYDTHVCMTVEEDESSYDLSVTGSMWVKSGQDCLWVL